MKKYPNRPKKIEYYWHVCTCGHDNVFHDKTLRDKVIQFIVMPELGGERCHGNCKKCMCPKYQFDHKEPHYEIDYF